MKNGALPFLGVAVLIVAAAPALTAATVVVLNNDSPGVGFNDPTPAAPVGGNPGTTIGQQRFIAFQAAADIWGANLNSAPAIRVVASFTALNCNAASAVLSATGPTMIFRSVGVFPFDNTWYHYALANKLWGANIIPDTPEIVSYFNSNLGQADCLSGTYFYYGLDGAHGNNIDMVTVAIHELAHGLGFSNLTDGATGAFYSGYPSLWDHFTLDLTSNKMWDSMTDAERAASAVNTRRVVWSGSNVTTSTGSVLSAGTPRLTVTAPVEIAGEYLVGAASFGPPLGSPGLTGELMPVFESGTTGFACAPLDTANALSVNGKVALIDRGTCSFTTKIKNAQDAGAIAVIIVEGAPGSPPAGLPGADRTILIPAVRITQADGDMLKAALRYRSRLHSGVVVNLGVNATQYLGADTFGRMLLYTPNPYQSGSSVSHWDTSATPNQLMEPNLNFDLTHFVTPPRDLTRQLLLDLGW